jgi:hypothetical protein
MQAWFAEEEGRFRRAEAIGYIHTLLLENPGRHVAYPYLLQRDIGHPGAMQGSPLRQ